MSVVQMYLQWRPQTSHLGPGFLELGHQTRGRFVIQRFRTVSCAIGGGHSTVENTVSELTRTLSTKRSDEILRMNNIEH